MIYFVFSGAPQLWHGELDILGGNDTTGITSVATSAADQDSEQEDTDDNESPRDCESPGDTNDMTKCNICQILSRAIVFGWTEFNRQRDFSPYIPSIMIDSSKFMFVLYNPQTDTLLTFEGFIHYYPFEDYFGLITLWVILNHRLFFIKHSIDDTVIPPCGFKRVMTEDLFKYESLMGYKESITAQTEIVDNVELQPRISVHSGFKRRRTDS